MSVHLWEDSLRPQYMAPGGAVFEDVLILMSTVLMGIHIKEAIAPTLPPHIHHTLHHPPRTAVSTPQILAIPHAHQT